jgi:hypothetical protein
MTIKVFYIEDNEMNSNKFEINDNDDDNKSKKEINVKSVDFCIETTNFNDRQQQIKQKKITVDEHKTSIAFSENYFKVKLNHRQSGALSEKDFQDSYSITKLQSDNVLHSSKNYLIKKYKPNKICNYNKKKLEIFNITQYKYMYRYD